ncbi:uncharacterized protein LOC114343807 isoform X1 [Diabrotica virgifera virgifera]|uniref:Uncharacterized protein LOC114343807 isoform X1 n=1 Tax=Diabrotica virgifera virgifera TaxID=50390 RepID=A0A6P7GWL2_DIAVI|nr:uncharacterized protein LOC114343807 isoform X1 [Diabrotica virgifera virgifera]
MNSIVLLAVCLLIVTNYMANGVTAPELKNLWDDSLQKCNIASSAVDKSFETGSMDPSLVKGIACLYKNLGVLTADNEFNKELFKAHLSLFVDDADQIEEIADACLIKKATPEESGMELFKCSTKKMKH